MALTRSCLPTALDVIGQWTGVRAPGGRGRWLGMAVGAAARFWGSGWVGCCRGVSLVASGS